MTDAERKLHRCDELSVLWGDIESIKSRIADIKDFPYGSSYTFELNELQTEILKYKMRFTLTEQEIEFLEKGGLF